MNNKWLYIKELIKMYPVGSKVRYKDSTDISIGKVLDHLGEFILVEFEPSWALWHQEWCLEKV